LFMDDAETLNIFPMHVEPSPKVKQKHISVFFFEKLIVFPRCMHAALLSSWLIALICTGCLPDLF
jgi:hypothetical protein